MQQQNIGKFVFNKMLSFILNKLSGINIDWIRDQSERAGNVLEKRSARKLRPPSLKTQTLWMSQRLRPEKLRPSCCLEIQTRKKYHKSVFTADRFKTSCLVFLDTTLTYADICREREREREKKTARRW